MFLKAITTITHYSDELGAAEEFYAGEILGISLEGAARSFS